jgi:fucose permease
MLAGAALLALLIEGAIADWSGVLMTEIAQVPVARSGLAYASFAAAMVGGRLGGDHVVRRFGPERIVRVGGLVVAAAVLVAIAEPKPWLICSCLTLCGLGMANVVPVLFSAAAQETPDHPTAGVATATMGGYSGFLLGPPLIGFGADAMGLRLSMLALSVAGLLICLGAGRVLGGIGRGPHHAL